MATTSNILTLLKYNSSKQKTGLLEYTEFADYIHRYAQHHIEENSDLMPYCSATYKDTLDTEINNLVSSKQVAITSIRNKEYICVVPYYIDKYAAIYDQIEGNILVAFPSINDIPKNIPTDILTKVESEYFFKDRLSKEEINDKHLYCVSFNKNLPSLLFPSTIKLDKAISLALRKIQDLFQKEESHDYFLKKLMISNPGKEHSIKVFFGNFCTNAVNAMENLKENGDTFYYWSQLCYFLKQDYTKLKDLTPEDVSILQSVAMIEMATAFHKSKAVERQQKETAFGLLDNYMKNPPYYFTITDIKKMKDKNGIPLLGQYKEEELMEHLTHLTQDSVGNSLPELLTFRVSDATAYYINKTKVIHLVVRLANDVRLIIRESLIKSWFKTLLEYQTLPEMKDNDAFERCLRNEISAVEPVLYSLLESSFLPVLSFEDQSSSHVTLFHDGVLVPYSDILMITRSEILADARLKLPFWYSMPLIAWIMKMLFGPKKNKNKSAKSGSVTLKDQQAQKEAEEALINRKNEMDSADTRKVRRKELRSAALEVEKLYVPENSTLDRELKGYMHDWNDRIGKQNYENLAEDVNSLIRDYFRKTLRTLKRESFNKDRIEHLAEALVNTPSMMKIKNHPALKRYIELYIIQIVKNLPAN
ncbi:MAG: hypothetical protein K6B17_09115 [Treponema sp.]|nr:hypothetical protein [Treponema sp.]